MANSITITCPNPALLAQLEKDITKLLRAYENTFRDAHMKRSAMLATISREAVLDDNANQAIAAVIEYAENEAHSLDTLGRDDERCKEEAEAAWAVIERARAIIQ